MALLVPLDEHTRRRVSDTLAGINLSADDRASMALILGNIRMSTYTDRPNRSYKHRVFTIPVRRAISRNARLCDINSRRKIVLALLASHNVPRKHWPPHDAPPKEVVLSDSDAPTTCFQDFVDVALHHTPLRDRAMHIIASAKYDIDFKEDILKSIEFMQDLVLADAQASQCMQLFNAAFLARCMFRLPTGEIIKRRCIAAQTLMAPLWF